MRLLKKRAQIKGVPGYTGHGPKVYAENIYGMTFKESRIRAKMLKIDQMGEEKDKLDRLVESESS